MPIFQPFPRGVVKLGLDAINLYQAHIDTTDNEAAKKILAHIRDDEKEHVAEFMELLKILDPGQDEKLKLGPEDFKKVISE
jgi:hypothetical protein